MENSHDIILSLLPHRGEGFEAAAFATTMPQNSSRFYPARSDRAKPRHKLARNERAGTEVPVEQGLPENTDCLVVRFSHGARSRLGVVGGHAEHADLVFPPNTGVSRLHLAFTFDDQYKLIVRDLGSTLGTKVTYGKEEAERRSTFDWLLQGPGIMKGRPPVLNITDSVQFKLIIPPHDITSPDYIGRVNKFRTGTADPDNLLASVILSAPPTRLPTGQRTPATGPRPILWKKKLAKGGFAVVTYIWNVTNGDEYVAKKPLPEVISSKNVDQEMWRREAEIMQRISHDHIVAFRRAEFTSQPQLEFEYVPGGSLNTYTNLSTFENSQVLCQLSSALEYLHSQQPSIVHRDIKPENILVVKRGVDGLYVKFADFGLSKVGDFLKTFCGTLLWAAPEIYLKAADPAGAADETYGAAIDIWSLGIVVASLECGLPEHKRAWRKDAVAWIRAVHTYVDDHCKQRNSELLWLLLDNMLLEDPDERSSADYCHSMALELLQEVTDAQRQGSGAEPNDDDGDGSATPRASMRSTGSAVEDESSEEASTFRLDTPVVMQIRETTELFKGSPTRDFVGLADSVEPQQSVVDGVLWGPASASPTREDSCRLPMTSEGGHKDVEGPGELHQSGRKRSWPAAKSPSSPLRPSSSRAGQQRATNRQKPVRRKVNTGM